MKSKTELFQQVIEVVIKKSTDETSKLNRLANRILTPSDAELELITLDIVSEIQGDQIAKYSKSQSERGKKPRKLTEPQKEYIMARYIKAKKEGSVYGLLKELSRRYEVTTRTISNVVKDIK